MQIVKLASLDGPNIYCLRPVVKLTVDLEDLTEVETSQVPQFADTLISLVPSLKEHHCSRGYPGGFCERLREGTFFGHVIEHLAIELQILSGLKVGYGVTLGTDMKNIYDIIFCYDNKESAITAGKKAIQIISSIINKEDVDLAKIIKEITDVTMLTALGPSTAAIVDEAKKRNIPVMRLNNESLVQLGYGKYQKRIQATTTSHTSTISVEIACDKQLARELLDDAGLPVPLGYTVKNEAQLKEAFDKINSPVVVKPNSMSQGKNVYSNIADFQDALNAFRQINALGQDVVIEKFISGKDYRILVINGKMEAAAERIPANVIGDGLHTIKELIEFANAAPNRGEDHEKPLTKVKIDDVLINYLRKNLLSIDSVIKSGEKIFLRENCNLSTGGTAKDITDQVHEKNIQLAVRAAKIVGLDIAGIDIICPDISKPINGDGAIIEINAAPGIRMHLHPSEGKPRNVAAPIVDMLFPSNSKSRIPIVAITGTNGKTTTSRLLNHALLKAGFSVGLTTTDGIYVKGEKIIDGDTTGPWSTRQILKNNDVDLAVLEVARGGIICGGLGFDHCDVAIITNVSDDHLGQDGVNTIEDLCNVKSLLVETLNPNGYAVLNADDPCVVTLAKKSRGEIIYFSLSESNLILHKHLTTGGAAVFVQGEYIVYAKDLDNITRICKISDIPLTYNGKAAFNTQNCLAACTALIAQNIPLSIIRDSLLEFYPSKNSNKGRANILDIKNFKVMVDYGHNPAGYQATLDFVKQLPHNLLTGVIAVPGDRLDKMIFKLGQIAANGFDKIIIKEDAELRGRQCGEVAEILFKGIQSVRHKSVPVTTILSEGEAVRTALQEANQNDLVVVFYENYNVVMDAINKFSESNVSNQNDKNSAQEALNQTAG